MPGREGKRRRKAAPLYSLGRIESFSFLHGRSLSLSLSLPCVCRSWFSSSVFSPLSSLRFQSPPRRRGRGVRTYKGKGERARDSIIARKCKGKEERALFRNSQRAVPSPRRKIEEEEERGGNSQNFKNFVCSRGSGGKQELAPRGGPFPPPRPPPPRI